MQRLKEAGFMLIGLGREELFHGFATPLSCREFLSATSLDDLIISERTGEGEGCSTILIQAAAKWLLDLDRSFIIGGEENISAAGLTGCTPLKIGRRPAPASNGKGDCLPNLAAAVERILKLATGGGGPP
ncbi:MAG TPA: hypothetical protein DCY13_17575, partial [Verrucomicrobiales bacterium]|nr:hypothetical protein [Verrucomicrobiales bacterium]